MELDSLTSVAERRALSRLLSIMENPLHALNRIISRQRSSFSDRQTEETPHYATLQFHLGGFAPGQGLVLYPQIGDKMDIVCPKLDSRQSDKYEYYKLYLVPKDQAEKCIITKTDTPLLNCVKPDQDVKFTLKFQEFSPNLWGLEFSRYKDYYIISVGALLTRLSLLFTGPNDGPRKGTPATRSPKMAPEATNKPSDPGRPPNPGSGTDGTTTAGHSSSIVGSEVALFAGIASGSVIFIIIIIMLVVLLMKYRRRHRKHSPQHSATLSLSTLATPKRGGNNNGSEPSDIIIPLRTADSVFCPHYEKVSGDYGHPVYIVQEMPPQSPANIYYKV
ncbi:EFNB2 protein, partial [Polypterus senegalus]